MRPGSRALCPFPWRNFSGVVTAICLISAPEGVKQVEERVGGRANVTVVTAAVDERLNDRAYIVPGLGVLFLPQIFHIA